MADNGAGKRIPPPADFGFISDDLAEEESQALAEGRDLEKERVEKDHDRGETLKDTLHVFVQIGIIIVGILFIAGIIVWAIHILAPVCWHWLTDEQLHEIQKIMSSALLAIVAGDYARKYLKP